MRVKVLRVTQSPMNAERWVLDLQCGHECWITSKTRPKRTTQTCAECEAKHPARPWEAKPLA